MFDPQDEQSFFYKKLEKSPREDAFAGFQEYFFENSFFEFLFREVYIINYSCCFTFVPSFLYDREYKAEIMDCLFSERAKERILEQRVDRQQLLILHSLPEEVYDFFRRSFLNARFVHYMSGLFSETDQPEASSRLLLNFRGTELDILAFQGENFLLGNCYECSETNDAVYYTLLVCKQLKLDQLTCSVGLTGDEDLRQEAKGKLSEYLQNLISLPDLVIGTEKQYIPFELSSMKQGINQSLL